MPKRNTNHARDVCVSISLDDVILVCRSGWPSIVPCPHGVRAVHNRVNCGLRSRDERGQPSKVFCRSYSIWIDTYSVSGSRDSAVGVAAGYWLDGRVSIPFRGKGLSVFQSVQTGYGTHPASYPVGAGGYFPGAWSWPLISISSSSCSCSSSVAPTSSTGHPWDASFHF
jgi:hypothetical protein